MIPIRLALRNFMPYREGELSFDGIHVACLCGDNGNGKSALLDAMTWALWGKARAKSDDELIHIGMTEMEVEFDFSVGPERYRIIRKRSRPKAKRAGTSILDLQIASADGFRSIAGNSIRETEQKVIDILRMDYDTFINSAFLLQGRADEFTKKEPFKRKQVLADVLGLSLYDELEERAKGHARQREAQASLLEAEIERIDQELGHKEEYEAQLRQVSEALAEAERERSEWESKSNALAKQRGELSLNRERLEQTEGLIKQAEEAISSFEGQVRDRRQRIERYEKALADYAQERDSVQARLGELAKDEIELEDKRGKALELSNRIHHLQTSNAALRAEMEGLKGKIDMLAQEEADCPLCGTELGADGRERIMANYRTQGEERKELFRANEGEEGRLEAERKALNQSIGELERATREGRAQWERREEALERARAEAEDALPQEREGLTQAEADLERWRANLKTYSQRRESLRAECTIPPELETSLEEARRTLEELARRQIQEQQTMGAIEEKLKRCASQEGDRASKASELKTASREGRIYAELAAAFGKKGIQAMIIEGALPEIEEEANALLARMTDNRLSVKMESQRQRKARGGEPMETLDINIADELGTRRYEMYSGGEAFRIDFALRIALSKLLARRAGAPLPTLIIDEGFGSQDAGGRERLVEAINSIQSTFDKILVITHIEELKDAFPVRIEVTKTPDGSTIEVS